ncbi:hypothetical protein [Actimicrobium sp. CCI2.3]|nr:hypothetical protein [Actimicrobium sp. CCI2.3]MDY7573602.1 hypothetical protein [Actimicrobium sp. CCI2.3]MEB0022115.1 hypothetical protein [Actimicrobium sp. CCI2.3]
MNSECAFRTGRPRHAPALANRLDCRDVLHDERDHCGVAIIKHRPPGG